MASIAGRQEALPDHGDHRVGFYETERFLAELVLGAVEPAIVEDQTAFVIMTAEHQRLVRVALTDRGLDVEGALRDGRLVFVDADVTRRELLVDGRLDRERFRSLTTAMFAHAGARGRSIHIFGYMVAQLWDHGHTESALALEDLWNGLASRHAFELTCAHPLGSFAGPDGDVGFREVCRRHDGIANESYPRAGEPEAFVAPVLVLRRGGEPDAGGGSGAERRAP